MFSCAAPPLCIKKENCPSLKLDSNEVVEDLFDANYVSYSRVLINVLADPTIGKRNWLFLIYISRIYIISRCFGILKWNKSHYFYVRSEIKSVLFLIVSKDDFFFRFQQMMWVPFLLWHFKHFKHFQYTFIFLFFFCLL